MQVSSRTSRERDIAWAMAAGLALTAPTALAVNFPPSSTFLNQAAALIGWGAWLAMIAVALSYSMSAHPTSARSPFARSSGLYALHGALALLLLAALASPFWTHLPWSLALSTAGLVAAAMLTAQVAASAQHQGLAAPAFRAFCLGLVAAGIVSAAIGLVQVFVPSWADGDWIARTYLAGRAVGNMRQPNHLSSLLLWAIVAVLWLGEARVVERRTGFALALLFVFVVVLSGSRTGIVSMIVLAGWGVLDRRLSRATRTALLVAPVFYAVIWFGLATWADLAHETFGAGSRFSGKGDISSSRFGIWSNTLALIRLHPWAGVGLGEFNFAWTLTPFPGRPTAFFDHTHNLVLQLAVELGVPLAAVVLALLGAALVAALKGALGATAEAGAGSGAAAGFGAHVDARADAAPAPWRLAAFVMVLLILIHSLLEYPLWYAYFLLPAAFAFGLCLGPARAPAAPAGLRSAAPPEARGATRPLLLGALLLMLGGTGSVVDYLRVVAIFSPAPGSASLTDRISDGRRSVFFAHHADYAAATTLGQGTDALAAFDSAPHYLLDARLMQAWAQALDDAGDVDRARFVAQRLREFNRDRSNEFFAACAELPAGDKAPLPFQCEAPKRAYRYQDFR